MFLQSRAFSEHYQDTRFCLALFITGTALFFLPDFIGDRRDRRNIMIITVNIAVIMMLYFFYNKGIYGFVWPFPMLIIFISTLYNNRFFLYSTVSVSVAGNLLMMAISGRHEESGDIIFYLHKILFLIILTYVATYIHKVYLRRLRDNESQMDFQTAVSEISTKLVSINSRNSSEIFETTLSELGTFFDAAEAFLLRKEGEDQSCNTAYNWRRDEERASWDIGRELSEYKAGQIRNFMFIQRFVQLDDLEGLPDDYQWIRELLIPDAKALTAAAIIRDEQMVGIMGLVFNNRKAMNINGDTREKIKLIENLMGDGLVRVEKDRKINFMAYYDSLTGLPNRALFFDRLEKAMALARRNEKKVAVLMMDLDSFKNINDSMGHDAGDLLLRQVSDRLSARIREYDTMSRFGGDEFLFILSELNHREEAGAIADKLLKSMAAPFSLGGEDFFVTGSLGISCFPEDGEQSEILIKNADIAMYASKLGGKNRHSFFHHKMNESADEKIRLSNELYRALDKKEFSLHYQPQLEIDGSRIIGMEALIRWNHPERGMIPPLDFIPLAEDLGLIDEIGRWVLYQACLDNKLLQDSGFPPIKVAVNVSLKQISGSSLVETVRDILEQTELQPEYLELEVTESTAMSDTVHVEKVMKELNKLGVTLSIDDFGTEYSSLSRLKHLPIDKVKIDKQFIHGITYSNYDESITSFIIALSKSMGLKVIAEGVENDN